MRRFAIAGVTAALAAGGMFIYVAPGGAAPPAYRTVGAKNGAGVGFFSTGKVSCPSGLHALGGGYFATSGVRVIASWPFNDTTWAVRGASDDGQTHTYFIYVRCHA